MPSKLRIMMAPPARGEVTLTLQLFVHRMCLCQQRLGNPPQRRERKYASTDSSTRKRFLEQRMSYEAPAARREEQSPADVAWEVDARARAESPDSGGRALDMMFGFRPLIVGACFANSSGGSREPFERAGKERAFFSKVLTLLACTTSARAGNKQSDAGEANSRNKLVRTTMLVLRLLRRRLLPNLQHQSLRGGTPIVRAFRLRLLLVLMT